MYKYQAGKHHPNAVSFLFRVAALCRRIVLSDRSQGLGAGARPSLAEPRADAELFASCVSPSEVGLERPNFAHTEAVYSKCNDDLLPKLWFAPTHVGLPRTVFSNLFGQCVVARRRGRRKICAEERNALRD